MLNGEFKRIKGLNPITNNQLTKEEIERCSNDSDSDLQIIENEISPKLFGLDFCKRRNTLLYQKKTDKIDAVYWIDKKRS